MNRQVDNVVVVGVDGSAPSTAAALWAAGEAQRRGATVRLLHAYQMSMGFAGPGVMMLPAMFDDVRRVAQVVLEDARSTVTEAYPALTVDTQLCDEPPHVALRMASERALLLVLGAHGHGSMTESLGSVAVKVANRSASPVVVVRADAAGRLHGDGPVWVALDGSANSDDALFFAFAEASLRGVTLVALHSWNDESSSGAVRSDPVEAHRARFEEEQRLLAEQLSGQTETFPDVEVRPLVLRGHPAATLLEHCGEAPETRKPSMMVVGSRGRGGFAGLLLGSTSQALISHFPGPVAIVRQAAVG